MRTKNPSPHEIGHVRIGVNACAYAYALRGMSAPWRKERVSNNSDKSGQEGRGLAENGHPFQCGLCKREKTAFECYFFILFLC